MHFILRYVLLALMGLYPFAFQAQGLKTHEPTRLDGVGRLEAAELRHKLHEQQPDCGEFG